ncbi:DUF1573 domain-containing protein [Marininema halotolerans]|uniref:DUF1573 domain-containing protein n=1 Tax=Marininema halotolerans TaxID=1155944 RepID=UPI000B819603|nr:DUF1573 domain-containing protein [Marininema halotolerans]
MQASILQSFQQQVSELLLRHRSFLDVSSKFQETNGRINRAVTKSVTECGCMEISANCQPFTGDTPLAEMKDQVSTHLSGSLCDHCLEVVIEEMGKNLFYLTALCNHLDISLDEVVEKESNKLSTLGVFNLR